MKIQLVTGDDNIFTVQCILNGQPVVISPDANVQAMLIEPGTDLEVGPVTCLFNAPKANWANGVVAVEFPSALSDTMPPGNKKEVEVQIIDGGKRTTYFVPFVTVAQDHIP